MKKYFMRLFVFCAVFMLGGCKAPMPTESPREPADLSQQMEWKDEVSLRKADSLDRAVIQKIDEAKQKITFYNMTVGKSYTLSYDNSTGIKSRYDEELVVGQLTEGDIAEVTFVKDEKRAKNIWLDKTSVVTEDVADFEINRTARTFVMNGEQYSIDAQAVVLSDGEVMTLMDVNQADTLRITSVDHTVKSIAIANGHGYIRLLNAEPFEGGWIELGQSIIRKVEKDMLLVVPAGTYEMLISCDDIVGEKQVIVTSDEETQIDVSELIPQEEEKDKIGGIIFTIVPAGAVLKIDGQETAYDGVVNLSYGIHHIEVTAEGYSTLSRYIKVGQEMANISINMEEKSDDKDNESEDKDSDDKNTVSGNDAITASDGSGNKVYIDAPEGAELYVDGKYIGVIPTSFEKNKGTYTVSVRKSGYITRSYSLEVDDSAKDVRYSFSSLEKES